MHHPNRALRRHRQLARRHRVIKLWKLFRAFPSRWTPEEADILRRFDGRSRPLHFGWEWDYDGFSRIRRYRAELRAIPSELLDFVVEDTDSA